MKYYFITGILLFIHVLAKAQQKNDTLKGKVYIVTGDETQVLAIGAQLHWLNDSYIIKTNPLGEFTIATVRDYTQLIVQHINAKNDTVTITAFDKEVEIYLTAKTIKRTATVTAQNGITKINYLNPILTVNIGKQELLKAACCNLSESFETTPGIDVSYSDAITGQKQIQMLGLAGPYTTITQENIPNIRGLASIEGLNFTPGTWVDGIQLSKGTGSVVNGYESLAGQINVELQKPDKADRIFVNVYQSTQGRSELNVQFNKKGEHFSHGLLMHYKNQWLSQDKNDDSFLDNPLGSQKIALYRWQLFTHNGFEWQGGVKGIMLNSNNSNMLFRSEQSGSSLPDEWQYKQNTDRVEAWMKFGKVFVHKPWKSVGLQLAGFTHNQQLNAGIRKYKGLQDNFYTNFIYQDVIGNTNHGIKLGASFLYDTYVETFPDMVVQQLNRKEYVPGIFAEHSYNYLDKLNIVTGVRMDAHNMYGIFATPRIHMRYVPKRGHTIRMSFGRAQRTASVLMENQKAYFSGRIFAFNGNVNDWRNGYNPEIAWNTGLSYSKDFELNYRKGNWTTDYYYSWFNRQVIADYETKGYVYFYNLVGQSYAHSFQTQIDYSPIKRGDIRMAYRLYDVKTQYGSRLLDKPLVSKHRAFINLAYATKNKWRFDYTLNYIGQKRISDGNALSSGELDYSPNYFLMNAHIAKVFSKDFEAYIGGENMTNYMQHHAIIGYLTPYESNFDASQIWGPVMGSNYYVGVRWRKH